MKSHYDSVTICPDKKELIPPFYKKELNKGIPVIFWFTIGNRGHGKTCYLSSFFHSVYYNDNLKKRWPGFTYMSADQNTINKITREYVNPLNNAELPVGTPIMFPKPLILEFQNIPLKTRGLKKLFNGSAIEQNHIMFIFYDIGGETFEVDERIKENLPILNKVNPLIFLIDLPGLIEDSIAGGLGVVERMHLLMGTIYLALQDLDNIKKKDIIICFTKADLMWGKEEIFGPLSRQLKENIPEIDGMSEYLDAAEKFSGKIGEYMCENYTIFYNALKNNFRNVYFTTVSSLGKSPKGDKLSGLAPKHIFEPILLTLRINGYL